MKTPSDNLFLLIKSLTKSEKRYFKLFARMHAGEEDASYVILFDLIEAQQEYDEHKIKQKLSGTTLAKNFAVAKTYLYKLILKSLFLFGANNDGYDDGVQQFIYGKILSKKGLQDQGYMYFSKSLEKSKQEHRFLLAADIQKWMRQFFAFRPNYFTKENIEATYQNIFLCIKQEEQMLDQMRLNDLMFIKFKKSQQARKQEDIDEITKIIKPYFKEPNQKYSTDSSIRVRHQNLALYYYYIGDYERQYEEMKKALFWAEKQKGSVNIYVIAIINMFGSCNITGRYEECQKLMKQLEEIDLANAYSEDYRLSVLFWQKLYLFFNTLDLDGAFSYIKSVERKIFKMDMKNYYYNLQEGAYAAAYIYFVSQKYSDSLKWLNKFFFFKNNNYGVHEDTYFNASVLYMLVHYELQNEDLLKYFIKQTYRWLLKAESLSEFEKTILNFIRKEMAVPKTHAMMLPAYQKLKNKILQLKKDPINSVPMRMLDLSLWLESKIQKRTMLEMIKNKATII